MGKDTQEAFVVNNGVRIFYVKKGEGKQTLLFIHGFPLDHTIFDCQIEAFSKCYTVVAIDRRGHGRSTKGAQLDYGLNAQVSDIAAVIRQLKLQCVTLVGHSVGSVYALATAANHPTLVKQVVTIGGFPAVFNSPNFPIGLPPDAFNPLVQLLQTNFPAFIETFVNLALTDLCVCPPKCNGNGNGNSNHGNNNHGKDKGKDKDKDKCKCKGGCEDATRDLAKLRAESTRHFIEVSDQASTLASFAASGPLNIVSLLSRIQVPVLITYGTRDQVIPPAFSLFLRQNLPNSFLLEFVNKGHLPMETDFCRFNRELKDFVSQSMFQCDICLSKKSKCKKGDKCNCD